MPIRDVIFQLVGGLGLFFIGMRFMSEGLQKAAGERLRRILGLLTNNRVVATMVGLMVTAIIQSSSATTVMTVSFVNAGLMTLRQALGVVLGANIGTTVTAQIIAFKIHHYALPALGIGVGLRLFSKSGRWRSLGEVIMGFGMLFFGLSLMKEAMEPLKASPMVREAFVKFDGSPLLGVLVGTIFTVLMQSSSVTVGIVMTLAASGLLSFKGAVALVLGDNIGTTVTAQLAATGGNTAAKRTAWSHTMFNVIGVIYVLILMPYFLKLVDLLSPGPADFVVRTASEAATFGVSVGDKPFIARHIANAHTLFNVTNTLVFLPILTVLEKITSFIVPQRIEPEGYHLLYLNPDIVSSTPIALEEARKETHRMMTLTRKMLGLTVDAFAKGDLGNLEEVEKLENVVDMLQREITNFLVQITQNSLTLETSREINSLINIVNNTERIGDHAELLAKLTERKQRLKLTFTSQAEQDIYEIAKVVDEFLGLVIDGVAKDNKDILPFASALESRINEMEDTMREAHIQRLNAGVCSVDAGLIFIDMLTSFEKIGDHCYNIAEALAGLK